MFLNSYAILSLYVFRVPSSFLLHLFSPCNLFLWYALFSLFCEIFDVIVFYLFNLLFFQYSLLDILKIIFAFLCLLARVLLLSPLGFCIIFRRALFLISKSFLQFISNHFYIFFLSMFPSIIFIEILVVLFYHKKYLCLIFVELAV